jgi:MmyB-like transcription regulator ligand binding domain
MSPATRWRCSAAIVLATFDDRQLAELVGELSLKSESFRRWRSSRDVKDKAVGTKRFNHPGVAELELE